MLSVFLNQVKQVIRSVNCVLAASMNKLACPKRLAAFDFDNTIVSGNTDIVIRDFVINEIPSHVKELVKTEGWTRYMEEIFRIIHSHKSKYTPEKILNGIREIPEVPGFVKMLKNLHQANFDLIVISDSNSVFIQEWTQAHGLSETFTEIFTNPARFSEDGLLTIKPYHHQTECKLSAENLCKGKILQEFIEKRRSGDSVCYENVVYVGDGTNDICPVMRLMQKDFGCVRKNYGMNRVLEKNKHKLIPKANIILWTNGFDLMEQLQAVFKDVN